MVDYFETGETGDGDSARVWPWLIRIGARIFLGAGAATGSCATLQHQCMTNCNNQCPCGSSTVFSCVAASGFADCNCNCIDCDLFDRYEFSWPTPSPIVVDGTSYPYVLWDYDYGGMLQIPGNDGLEFLIP